MILTIGNGGCGFTFLNWSISYLRGDNTYTNLTGQVLPVTDNPLDGRTSHKFFKDHVVHNIRSTHLIKNATKQSIIYTIPETQTDFDYFIGLPGKKIVFDNTIYCRELFARHIITVPPMRNENLKATFDRLCKSYPVGEVKATMLDCAEKIFSRHYQIPNNVYVINYKDIFDHLETKIHALFEYLELSMVDDRYKKWVDVYIQYSARNQNLLDTFKLDATVGSTRVIKELFNG